MNQNIGLFNQKRPMDWSSSSAIIVRWIIYFCNALKITLMRLPPQYWISSYKRIHLSKNSNYCDKKSAFCQFIQWCITFHGALNKLQTHYMNNAILCLQNRHVNNLILIQETTTNPWYPVKKCPQNLWPDFRNQEQENNGYAMLNPIDQNDHRPKTFLIETLTPLGSHAHYNNHECWLTLFTTLNWVGFCTRNRYLNFYSR